MNTSTFKNYQSDITKIGGVDGLPEMHRQAYEIIKEASSDFTDWDQLIAVAEEPDIQKLIDIHLEWLHAQLNTKAEAPKTPAKKEKTFKYQGKTYSEQEMIDFAEASLHYEDEDHPPVFKSGEEALAALKKHDKAIAAKSKAKPKSKPSHKNWWITTGTVRQRLEKILDMLVDTRMDAFDGEEDVIAGIESEIRELVEQGGEISRKELQDVLKDWQGVIDQQSVNSVQENLLKIGQELQRIVKTMPKTTKTENEGSAPVKRGRKPKAPKELIKVTGGEVRYTEDVKFIRSFLTLLAGDQGRTRMINFYKRMAKANAEKRFTDSKYKSELNQVAGALHDAINEGKSKLSADSSLKDRLLEIRDQHQLSASVKVIKRFYNLIGERPAQKKVELILRAADKISESDPHYPDMKKIIFRLQAFLDKDEKLMTIDQPTIQGLAGVLKSCGCKLSRGSWEDAVRKKA